MGSSAGDPASLTRPVLTRSGGNLILTVPLVSARRYTLQSSATFAPGSWTDTGISFNRSADGTQLTFTVPPPAPAAPRRFYRVKVER